MLLKIDGILQNAMTPSADSGTRMDLAAYRNLVKQFLHIIFCDFHPSATFMVVRTRTKLFTYFIQFDLENCIPSSGEIFKSWLCK